MKVDMSRKVIDNRLRRVSELRELCFALGKSKQIGDETSGIVAESKRDYQEETSGNRGRSQIVK